MPDNRHTKVDKFREELRARLQEFAERLQDEVKGAETRVKEGIRSAGEDGKRADQRFGRPPTGRPPSGRRPSRRPPSIRP